MLITIIKPERLQMWSEQSAGPDFPDFFCIFGGKSSKFCGMNLNIEKWVAKGIIKLWLACGSANQVLGKNKLKAFH